MKTSPASQQSGDTSAVNDYLDLDSLLSRDELDARELVRGFCDKRLRDVVPNWFEHGLPEQDARDLMLEFGKLGVLGMHLEGYGCPGLGAVSYGLACTELEAIDSGLRSMVSVQGSLAMSAIRKFGSEEQKQTWLPRMAAGEVLGCFGLTEPDSGSDPGSMRAVARRDRSDWVLNGTKMWITNGSIADIAVVWARTDDGVRGFLVPAGTPGLTAPHMRGKLSMRASITSELILDNVRLPASAQLPGARGLRGPLSCLGEARFGIVFGVLGAAREALRTAVDYAATRTQFGKPIGGFQLTQQKLVEMLLELQKATLLALHLGRLKESGRLRPEQLSVGKLNNVRAALEVCRTARTVLGANGIMQEYPVMRHMANLESVLTYEGTVEVHTLVIGQALTGQNAFR
ncbi:acyl-CoA dehydrogenase family protein [Kribbella sp. NPDC049227]|uniref:acyl-CoA dehydrogenase family protein n=1 Tax=Kribbella sp. NPDC049227 TaxID=3364113 RepID=UPI0037232C81